MKRTEIVRLPIGTRQVKLIPQGKWYTLGADRDTAELLLIDPNGKVKVVLPDTSVYYDSQEG